MITLNSKAQLTVDVIAKVAERKITCTIECYLQCYRKKGAAVCCS